ncbi:coagulation factor XIII B chain-like [Dendropsophus ebraccatus]|uniref:coagulation factor XIII B chain-like n=1 Tax=Dendropsophus ebraccatus TaxID=150705 RepID=UPI003831D436
MACIEGTWFHIAKGQCKKDITRGCTVPHSSNLILSPHRPSYPVSSTVSFTCGEGFTRVGDRDSVCTEEGWNPSLPKCEEIKCVIGESHNLIRNPLRLYYREDDQVFVDCDEGFKLNGPNKITCTKNGWNPPLPICDDITVCTVPQSSNLILSPHRPSYPVGSTVSFTCDEGFTRVGDRDSVCTEEGWDPSLPKCEDNSCAEPPEITHGTVIETKKTFNHGEKVTYECKKGFQFPGEDSAARCMWGRWINIPKCVIFGAPCGPPPVVQYGDTISFSKFSYKSGESVQYVCPEYYKMNGSSVVRCMHGVWDEAPVCLEPCTARQKNMEENNIQLKWTPNTKLYSQHGDSIEFQCKSGYEAPPGTAMRIPCLQGKLDYLKCFKRGFCVLDQSAMITNNIHYNQSSIVDHGQTITFQCNKGTKPENNLEGKCEQKKINYPKCVAAKSCETPKILNGFLRDERQASYVSGSSAELKCKKDYVINGPINAKCENGEWTELPVCLRPCRISPEDLRTHNIQLLPSDDPNDVFDRAHLHGTELGVTCMLGFRRPNSAALVIECYDGDFGFRKCFTGKTCRLNQDELDRYNLELDEMRNSDIFYEENESVYFKCKTGYYSKARLVGRCSKETLSYPRCTARS